MTPMSERDRYFQEISRAFLARRGAPFFLSPKDLELIASWEKAGIPLALVLEGIERAFAPLPAGAAPRGKVLTLAFCQNQVRKLHELRRERRVGRTGRSVPGRAEKRLRALAEVEEFLARGAGPPGIEAIARRARALLAAEGTDEEALERLDEEADAALADSAADDDRQAAGADAPGLTAAAARTRLIKHLRINFCLPFFALFYY